jgi:hypothetical protein
MPIVSSLKRIAGIAVLVSLLASACQLPGPVDPRDDDDDPRPPDQEVQL